MTEQQNEDYGEDAVGVHCEFNNLNNLTAPDGTGLDPASHLHQVETLTSTCRAATDNDRPSCLRSDFSSAPVITLLTSSICLTPSYLCLFQGGFLLTIF